MKEAKVALALPLWRIMYAESVSNLVALMMNFPFYSVHITENFRVDRAREEMTYHFLASDATHLFCLDSDMGIPLNAVARLLTREQHIVGGLYVSRREEHFPFIWEEMYDEQGRWCNYQVAAEWPKGALVECDITGAGFLLVAREVFEAFGPPWWLLDEGDEGGTDIAFLRRARKAGLKVYVDTSLESTHYGIKGFTIKDFYRWRDENHERIIEPGGSGNGRD